MYRRDRFTKVLDRVGYFRLGSKNNLTDAEKVESHKLIVWLKENREKYRGNNRRVIAL